MNKLQTQYFAALQQYEHEISEASYPYSETAGQYPEKHPFENAPAEILDDEKFLIECFELDHAECFKFCSYRLRNKKDFVMKALKHTNPEHDLIGDNLKHDFDILKNLNLKDFSKFGQKILKDEKKILQIIKKSNYSDYKNYHWLSFYGISKKKSFFLNLIDNSNNTEFCLKWADNSLKNDFNFISQCISKNAKSIKFANKNINKFEKLVLKAIKKDGEVFKSLGSNFLNNKKIILLAAKTNGEVFRYIKKSLRNDKQIAFKCLLKNPQMLRLADKKFKANKNFILKLIRKDFECFKYIDKKLKLDPQVLKTVILNTTFGSGDEYRIPAKYLSKLGDRNLIKFAINKTEWWFHDLSKKFRNDKELALLTVKKSDYQFKYVGNKLKKDKDILEAAAQNFLKGSLNSITKKIIKNNINDLDNSSVNLLDRDLYWYIFDKVNSDKLNKKEYLEDKRINGDTPFNGYDVVIYSGEMLSGRPHGKGYATNEDSEWGDAAFPSTYEGQWANGLPEGIGEFKQFTPNHFPPHGKIDQHYIGPFKSGEKHGEGKELLHRYEDGKIKWRKVEYKNGKLVSYKN